MRMRLPNGNTAKTDAGNASVLGAHFTKVFCTYLPFEWSTLEELIQRNFIQEIYQPISWDELKAEVKILTNNKVPVLNKLPPNSFKSLNNDKLTCLIDFF